MTQPIFSVENLEVALRSARGTQPLVKAVDLQLFAGTITGLAGESGSGKSLTALALMGLLDPHQFAVTSGSMILNERRLNPSKPSTIAPLRGRDLAMVFQDPSTALDPVYTVGWQLAKTFQRLLSLNRSEARTLALKAARDIGFSEPEKVLNCYPHQLSGGMRQLMIIAMARTLKPGVLLADEPTTALDAASQALVLDALASLARDCETAVLLITHDLRLLTQHADQLLVMYHGRIVERTTGRLLFERPQHPYSAGLMRAIPRLNDAAHRVESIPGQVPPAGEQQQGCAFAPRCRHADAHCQTQRPELITLGGVACACHHPLPAQEGC